MTGMNWRTIGLVVAIALTAIGQTRAEVVGRKTNDWAADLVDELIRLGRFDEATAYCIEQSEGADPTGDAIAKWAIKQSQSLSAAAKVKSKYSNDEVEKAQSPVTILLGAYPGHRRQLFLLAQLEAVRRDAAQHAVVTFAVSPATESRVDEITKLLSRSQSAIVELARKIADQHSSLQSARSDHDHALIADLQRLEQYLLIDAVSLSLMQTELFAAGSRDRLGAAAQAVSTADKAINNLPADSAARREVERLRVEAMIRGQQLDRAETDLVALARSWPKPLPHELYAMRVRIDVLRGSLDAAEKKLDSFFGSSPELAARSIEMDLARTQWLIAKRGGGDVGAWLDAIERRNGLYGRRRAEAIALSKLRSQSGNQPIDSALVVAQGEDWLRRGDYGRAADLFSSAAVSERDGKRAIQFATKAAAALIQIKRAGEASEILAAVARDHQGFELAPATHLQAAVTYHSSDRQDKTRKIESLLKEHLQRWPDSDKAPAARQWLVQIYESQNRLLDAAVAASMLSPQSHTAQELDTALARWVSAVTSAEQQADVKPLMQDFLTTFKPLTERPSAAAKIRETAALVLDRELLGEVPAAMSTEANRSKFYESLLAYRDSAGQASMQQVPPDEISDAVRWRLMRDGRQYPQMRTSVANLIQGWSSAPEATIDGAERSLWLGDAAKAESSLRALIKAAPAGQRGSMMRKSATLLASTENKKGKELAVTLWDELAAGSARGSSQWHEAKLGAIELLRTNGQGDQASRRAKYILLTSPPKDQALRRRYEMASQ